MWKLDNIKAQNVCAFKDLDYSPRQGCTTLVFGNNLDNDSQGSNGSGKSALIEAVAIGLTGDSLRKVKSDEIINDTAETAKIVITLKNDESDDVFVVERTIDRKSSQQIVTTLNGEAIVQPSVLEYNKYILDVIGLTKEDIFSNFILSKHKYSSFLNASDREKKELINRFSNGSMVDESIVLLQADMNTVRFRLSEAEKEAATCQGRVDAINEQIITTKAEYENKENRKTEIIAAHREAIAKKREAIRQAKESIKILDKSLEMQDEVDGVLRNMEEDGNIDVATAYSKILELFRKAKLHSVSDYDKEHRSLLESLEAARKKTQNTQNTLAGYEKDVQRASKEHIDLKESLEELEASQVPASNKLKQGIGEAQKLIQSLETENQALRSQVQQFNEEIDKCERALAGTIECPKCKHQFMLNRTESVEEIQKRVKALRSKLEKTTKTGISNKSKIEAEENRVKSSRKELRDMTARCEELSSKVRDAITKLNRLQSTAETLRKELFAENVTVNTLENRIQSLRQRLFDEAFDNLDAATKEAENAIKSHEINITTWNGNVQSYLEAIKETESATIDDALKSLEEKKEKYGQELTSALSKKESIEGELNELIAQESRFIDFKTHLANSKIEALGIITNEFLEAIGSDLRISFSGYTTLKSGKIRDKISISVVRDGMDCGSFAKMSQGEQCRANLASILALHKLTNMNCQDGKGLELLILDEILDATDEAGLANMFDALNSLQITAMVVSHGLIHESYPYRLTVTKQNGVSILNENNQ